MWEGVGKIPYSCATLRPVFERVRVCVGGGGPYPSFQHLFHYHPVSRTSVISIPSTVSFPNIASHVKTLANPYSRVAFESPIPSRNFTFSRIPHRVSVNSRIPSIPFQTLRDDVEGWYNFREWRWSEPNCVLIGFLLASLAALCSLENWIFLAK